MGKKRGVSFINHTLVQMFPRAPHKTTNCVATVLTFAVSPQKKNALVKDLLKELGASSLSKNTGMAVFEGISIPKRLFEFSQTARSRLVTAKEAMALSDLVDIYQVTGEEGIIGAVGALGMSESHEGAVVPAAEPKAQCAGK
jgi:tRNA(Ile2) C34 agmatinyltransferase TiaS